MPTAREALLDAAAASLALRAWSAVRMVDVAATAGVSRQTLYNEFGSKEGLARALVRREADGFFAGVDRVLGERAGTDTDRLVGVAEWMVRAARADPLVRALLTGCWPERLPSGRAARAASAPGAGAAQRRADRGVPGAADVVAEVRERVAAGVQGQWPVEMVVRVAVSWVVGPGQGGDVGEFLRGVLGKWGGGLGAGGTEGA
ncbi:TetR/AcrR family transcriptional regulator [Streptomyces sp. NPDC058657]|uniref:TetR/AcrR family transcriptional regulator n=1 Tax=unclassified Streptomyces TaxID=2593676 RepID=UPI0036650AD5